MTRVSLDIPEMLERVYPAQKGEKRIALPVSREDFVSFLRLKEHVVAALIGELASGPSREIIVTRAYWMSVPREVPETWKGRNAREVGSALIFYSDRVCG